MSVNKNYKDSVFTALFNQPDPLRDLYCAIKDVTLPPDVPVSINTLENVLFLDFYNDISFEIGGKLVVLIEHQSTINPNMALRLLLYISRLLEKRIKSRTLYSKKPVSIPWPEFYVLYNGPEPFPDNAVLQLSDLFEKPEKLGLAKMDYPLLELEVRVININEGRNKTIANRCKKLAEYSTFIAKARAFWDELGSLEEAIKAAIKYCSRHDILTQFLEIHGSEVLNMILEEWNTEDAIAFAREEGREDGLEEGREEVMELLAQGLTPEEIKARVTGKTKKEPS
jgi:hypothetical protein